MPESFREIRAARLAAEVGTLHKQAGLPFALCYPSPYAVGMSSLGFQTVYRTLNGLDDVSAERAFLPDDARAAREAGEPLRTYESARAVGDFPVVAFSLAYELELAGVVDSLDLSAEVDPTRPGRRRGIAAHLLSAPLRRRRPPRRLIHRPAAPIAPRASYAAGAARVRPGRINALLGGQVP